MALTEDAVRETLKQVIDPELFVNIVDLGLIYEVSIGEVEPQDGDAESREGEQKESEQKEGKTPCEGVKVTIDMTMTSPACPAGPQLIQNSKDVVGRMDNVAEVEVKIVMIPPWTPDLMTEDAKDQLGIF